MIFAAVASNRAAGSPVWQTVFICVAVGLILFEIVRGWRLGLVRQVVRLFALVCAYAVAMFAGRVLLPVLRPIVRLPDFVISLAAGAILALLVYAAISTIGAILFKRTAQQNSGIVRLTYGVTGAALGVLFGLFSVWLVIVAIRATGALANAELRSDAASARAVAQPKGIATSPGRSMIESVARLQNSIELGPLGAAVRTLDVLPKDSYETLGKIGAVVSNPANAERFLSSPGARQLSKNPRIVALREDPEIMDLIEQQRFLELLRNPKVIQAVNDPALAAELRRFDFRKAIDYAGKR